MARTRHTNLYPSIKQLLTDGKIDQATFAFISAHDAAIQEGLEEVAGASDRTVKELLSHDGSLVLCRGRRHLFPEDEEKFEELGRIEWIVVRETRDYWVVSEQCKRCHSHRFKTMSKANGRLGHATYRHDSRYMDLMEILARTGASAVIMYHRLSAVIEMRQQLPALPIEDSNVVPIGRRTKTA